MRLSLLAAVVALLAGASGAGAAGPTKTDAAPSGLMSRSASPEFVPGELIVQFRAGVSSAARRGALSPRGARVARSLGTPGLTLVRLPKGVSVQTSAAALARDPRVAFAEPNYLYQLTAIPNDTLFPQLWGLNQASDRDIDAPAAWDITTGSSSVIVAVIDSGIAYDHPDLAANMWVNDDPVDGDDDDGNGFIDDLHGWDTVQEDAEPLDSNGHGTHVAGTIGAVGNNSDGVTGVNWDVSLMAVRAGDANGLQSSNIFQAVQYACNNGADIVNGSFGGPGKSSALANLMKSAACKNTLFVFAAGNDGVNLTNNTVVTNSYPCEYHRPAPHGFSVPNVVCVAATTRSDALASFSNRGKAAVHLAAPGGNGGGTPGTDILSTWPGYQTVWGPDDMETDLTWGDPINLPPAVTQNWARTNAASSSATFSLTDSPGVNYVNNALRTIRNMSPIDLTDEFGCLVEYDLRLSVEPGFDWFGIFAGVTTVANDAEIQALSGTTGGQFVTLESDPMDFDGESEVYIRFFLDSDGTVTADGAYVDDVLVKCVAANGEDYRAIPGTSMASPHVAGVAALLLAARPSLSVAKLKNALLKGVEKKTNLTNHVSTGGRLNARSSVNIALDTTRPTTTITGRPANRTKSRAAKFRFRSNEGGGSFQCKHMNGGWRSCSSPKTYRRLGPGKHTFLVRAIDKAGNVDLTPAKDVWRIRR